MVDAPEGLVLLLLSYAAWRDVATRLIPDWISVAILCCAVLLQTPRGWEQALLSASASLAIFAALAVLCVRGALGGGDVKLAAAVTAALPIEVVWDFLLATAISGGLIGLAYLALRERVAVPAPAGGLLGRVAGIEARRMRRGGPLPYALAIAAGGALAILTKG
ncbi:prepilin peptidase [Roseomonas sp. CCTCC AB2023176]|uniref:A24 family peptidase n=1 Tax=Roseomonas sp. CCTCC AB2023176 TaxID=3342640 RepID=UPI0035D55F39